MLYNALSSAACGSLLYGYLRYRNRGPRWAGFAGPPPHLKGAAVALQGLGLVVVVVGLVWVSRRLALN